MYTEQQRETVVAYGNWLGSMPWDTFSTITYRYDVKEKQNYKIMSNLERYLMTLEKRFNMFWVTEFTNYNYNTHNHLLVKGNIVRDIEYHLRCQCLIGKHTRYYPYKEGAAMYVSKYVCDDKTNWGLIKN